MELPIKPQDPPPVAMSSSKAPPTKGSTTSQSSPTSWGDMFKCMSLGGHFTFKPQPTSTLLWLGMGVRISVVSHSLRCKYLISENPYIINPIGAGSPLTSGLCLIIVFMLLLLTCTFRGYIQTFFSFFSKPEY